MRKLPATAFKKGLIPHNRGLRHEARLRGDEHYFTGKPCKNGHVAKRMVSNGCCMECARINTSKHRQSETEEQRLMRLKSSAERAAAWRAKNPDHENTKIVKRRYMAENREKINSKSREYTAKNKEKVAQIGRLWRLKYPEKNVAKTARRNAAKMQRTPSWLNHGHWFEITAIYELCAAWRKIGMDYHVDHIVPLQGETVSGLHVPWNLQVLPAKQNLSKSNRI